MFGTFLLALLREVATVPFLDEEIEAQRELLVPVHTAAPGFESRDSHALLVTPPILFQSNPVK